MEPNKSGVTEEMMRDAGLTDMEIRRPDLYLSPTRIEQVKQGFKWLCGEWRKVTDADAAEWREGVVRAKAIKSEKKAKLDLAFAEGGDRNASRILGSDWGANCRDGDLKANAYAWLESTGGFEARELARIERILARLAIEPAVPEALKTKGTFYTV